jgi:FtsZ-interacting cell division protein YlmF
MMNLFSWAVKSETRKRETAPAAEIPAEKKISPQDQAAAVLFNINAPAQTPSYNSAPSYHNGSNFGSAFSGNTLGNRHIMVIQPKCDSDVIGIVEHLKTNEAVIVNFEGIPTAETQRRIDFLSGVACGLGGTIRPLDNHKYIITPSGIGVR